MKYSELLNYCLSKNGAYIDHPFGPESDIIKVEGKIFAQLFILKGKETATLDAEGEYTIVAESLGGINIVLSPTSKTIININLESQNM